MCDLFVFFPQSLFCVGEEVSCGFSENRTKQKVLNWKLGGGFKYFFMFTPIWANDPF